MNKVLTIIARFVFCLNHSPSKMGGIEKTFDKLFHYTVANVTRKDLKDALAVPGCGGVLVTGAHGAGKTELVRNVLHTARTDRASLTCK
jgi:peroxin-1